MHSLVTREQVYPGAVQDAQKINLILVIKMTKLIEWYFLFIYGLGNE